MGAPNSWMVYNGKSDLKCMIWGYPHFRKPPKDYCMAWKIFMMDGKNGKSMKSPKMKVPIIHDE